MFCPYCGATNPDDAAFCKSCRATISAPQGVQPAPVPTWQTPGQPPAPGTPAHYDREPYQPQQQYFTYAAFWPRFGAYLLDGLFASLIAMIPGIIVATIVGVAVNAGQEEVFTQTQRDQQSDDLVGAIIVGFFAGFVLSLLAYQIIATAKGGGWGKRIVGLRVLRARDGAFPGYGTALLRVVATAFLGAINLIQLLDYLWCIWDGQKQTWHDKIAGTVVVVARS